jgi:hypothetical protein
LLNQEANTEVKLWGAVADELVKLTMAKDLAVEGGGERTTL